MKVHELIELLKTCPQEADVEINITGDYNDVTHVDVVECKEGSSTVELQIW